MGTRVAVLDKGRLQQVDTPQRIYDAPANLFVATFMGSPAMNLLDATVVAHDDGRLGLDLGGQRLPVDDALLASHPALAERTGGRVVVGVRPEALEDAALEPEAPGEWVLDATVDLVESLGAELVVYAAVSGATAVKARLSTKSRVRAGDTIKLVVDPGGLHLFDPDSGESLRVETQSDQASLSAT